MRKLLVCSLLFWVIACFDSVGHAHDGYAPEQTSSPSVFRTGYRGLLTGGLVGVSAGYLVARADGYQGETWRALALGAGIGAVSGAGLGLGLGLFDLTLDERPRAHLVLRDMLYGTTFGALTGAVVGSLFIINSGDPEHALFGTAIGAVSGAGFGLIVGIIDSAGTFERQKSCKGSHTSCHAHRYVPTVSTSTDVSGRLVFAPSLAGRF